MRRCPLTVGTSARYFSARRTAPARPKERDSLSANELPKAVDDWLLDAEYRLQSPRTIETRRIFLKNLAWFLGHRGYTVCGTAELKEFLHYLRHGHEESGFRWGNKQCNKSVRPETVKDYWISLSTFFKWLVAEGVLDASPMARVVKPVVRQEEKQPLTPDQVKSLLAATRRSLNPRRDEALVLLLLDTGIRSSELIGLKIGDMDLHSRRCNVLGKGNKMRTVHFGTTTGNALRLYLRQHSALPDDPLFLADKSGGMARPLTRSGLQHLLSRLGRLAGLKTSSSPHALRRTFAVTWLRNGANVFSLQAMLGHSELRMTQRYLALSRADIADQARQFSPADSLRQTKG